MSRLLRRSAAILAALSLLAVPARGLLACEMAAPVEATSAERAPAAHHAMAGMAHGAEPASQESGSGERAPDRHPGCDHVVGCAPLALTSGAMIVPALVTTLALGLPLATSIVEAPAPSLEPPPPKR